MKRLYYLLLMGMLIPSMLLAQEEGEVSLRNFLIEVEFDTGTLVNDTTGIFDGNSAELIISYNHTFNRVRFLSWYIKSSINGGVKWNRFRADDRPGSLDPEWEVNGVNGIRALQVNLFELGLRFSDYGYISIDSGLYIEAFVYAPIRFGNHTVKFLAGIEAYPFFFGIKKLVNGDEGTAQVNSIENIAVGLAYSYQFQPNWGFTTELQYRTGGQGDLGGSNNAGQTWELDSLFALKVNSNIRWDNTFVFSNDQGYSVWAQVRYHAKYFIPNNGSAERAGKPMHEVYLRFGFTKRFDI